MILALAAFAQDFSYNPAGTLQSPGTAGDTSARVWVPDMRFPLEAGPAYANSQVYGHGGSQGTGGQCDAENYQYPWSDNYCEARTWPVPLCPAGTGHQGQDIRPATCKKDEHWAVATEAGTISHVGDFSVSLMTAAGVRHRYLHLSNVSVKAGDVVTRGQRIGQVSNVFGSTATTIHLHYDIQANVEGVGPTYVSPYMSLVRSYEAMIGEAAKPCAPVPATGRVIDDTESCARLYGNLTYWRTASEGEGGTLRWTKTWTGATPSNYAAWTLAFEAAGTYVLEARTSAAFGRATKVPYVIDHADGRETVTVSQAVATDWIELGTFRFEAAHPYVVKVLDNTGEAPVPLTFDALRVRPDGSKVPVDNTPAPTPPTPSPTPTPTPPTPTPSGGCGCDHGAAFLLVLPAALLLRRPRRTPAR